MNYKPTLDTCLNLLDKGFSLIPVNDKKQSLIKWEPYKTKAMDKSEFTNFYDLHDCKMIAVVCGYNGLEVLDVDAKVIVSTDERRKFWKDFTTIVNDNIEDFKYKFVIVKTINNGYHLIYRTTKKEGNKKIATPECSKEALIETRGVGGYAILYDVFINGSSYADVKLLSNEDRDILFGCAKIYNHEEENKVQYEKIKKYTPTPKNGITPWEDFNSRNTCWDLVSGEFTKVSVTTDNKLLIRRHGAKSPHSGYIYKNDILYLFSTGTRYPHEEGLTPFMIYAIQNHNGDIKSAARQLYDDGFGSRSVVEINKKKFIPEELKISKDIDFPLDIFPDNIQAYILDVHTTLNSSIDYLGSSLLWVLSLCVGNAIKLEIKTGWSEPGIIWIAIVGRAGVGKTHNIESMVKPLKKLNEKEIELYNRELERYTEFKQMTIDEKKKTSEPLKEPNKKQFIVGDITMEAFIDYHASNPNGVGILRDELSGWIKDLNKYREGSDLENYLSGWSGSMLNLTRKTTRSGYVPNAFIPILGGVQPSVLSEIFTVENKDNGFHDRWLLCYPDLTVNKFTDKEMRREVVESYNDNIVGFYEQIRRDNIKYDDMNHIVPFYLTMDGPAYKEWIRIHDKITEKENSDDENEYMKSILPKQKSYVARFALLLNIFEDFYYKRPFGQIRKKSMLDAERLSDYFIKMAQKNKVDSLENIEIKNNIKDTKGSVEEKFKEMYKKNPEINRTKAAEMLNVGRTTIYRWIKEDEN